MANSLRVGVIALLHESNTFISQPTTLTHFQENVLLRGEAVREHFADTHHEVGGFFAGLAQAEITAVPIFAARAVPYGTIAAETFAALWEDLQRQLEAAGALDGLLVAPHGATVSEVHRDADGWWLSGLRDLVGGIPIIGTLDAHANVSPRMADACEALIAYRTNPHLDQRARGAEAAALMARTLRGEVRPTMAAAFPPLAINIDRQETDQLHWQRHYALADSQLRRPGVLSNSILLGFPYADVEEMGASTLAVTNGDPELARSLADELAQSLWDHREDFCGQLISVEDAIDMAVPQPAPVCLLDMGDNVGGGSPADGTVILHALHQRRISDAFVCLFDPQAVEQAARIGAGQQGTLTVGGKTDALHGSPLTTDVRVRGLFDGKFTESQPRHGGFTHCDQGPTAVVETLQGLTVMLTTKRMPPFSLEQLRSCRLDPASFHILVAKGVNAPVAAYREVCELMIRVNTPGVTTADLNQLTYIHRRQPLFPFERSEAQFDT